MSLLIWTEKAVDKYIFGPLCSVIGLVKSKKVLNKKEIKKILVVKIWALGDSVVLLPTLDALKKKFPRAEIHVLAHKRNKMVFEGQKCVDAIIPFGAVNILKLMKKYDICIDTEPFLNVSAAIAAWAGKHRVGFSHGIRARTYHQTTEFKKTQHMVQNYLDFARAIGVKYNTDSLLPLVVGKEDKKIVSRFLNEHGIEDKHTTIGLAPGVAESVKYRMWPVERFAKLADMLIEEGFKVIFIDSKSNIPTIHTIQSLMKHEAVNAAGLFDVQQAAELIAKCDAIVAIDSGLMHIAAAQGTKTIGLFGPNTPVLWGPYGKKNIALFKPKKGCPYIDNTNPKLIPRHLTEEQLTCMDAISVADVIKSTDTILQK